MLVAIEEGQVKVVLHTKLKKVMHIWPRHDYLVLANTLTNKIGNLSAIRKFKEQKSFKGVDIKNKKFIGRGPDLYLPQPAQTMNKSN